MMYDTYHWNKQYFYPLKKIHFSTHCCQKKCFHLCACQKFSYPHTRGYNKHEWNGKSIAEKQFLAISGIKNRQIFLIKLKSIFFMSSLCLCHLPMFRSVVDMVWFYFCIMTHVSDYAHEQFGIIGYVCVLLEL